MCRKLIEAEEKYDAVMVSMQEAAAEYKEVLSQYDLEFEEKGQQMSEKLHKVCLSTPRTPAPLQNMSVQQEVCYGSLAGHRQTLALLLMDGMLDAVSSWVHRQRSLLLFLAAAQLLHCFVCVGKPCPLVSALCTSQPAATAAQALATATAV